MGFFRNLLDSFTGGVGSAVSSAIGGAVGQVLPLSKSEKQQNAFNAEQAKINRDWQEQMSNTSYQACKARNQSKRFISCTDVFKK